MCLVRVLGAAKGAHEEERVVARRHACGLHTHTAQARRAQQRPPQRNHRACTRALGLPHKAARWGLPCTNASSGVCERKRLRSDERRLVSHSPAQSAPTEMSPGRHAAVRHGTFPPGRVLHCIALRRIASHRVHTVPECARTRAGCAGSAAPARPRAQPGRRTAGCARRASLAATPPTCAAAALHCAALHCTTLHCIALHCTALHCTALHCTPACLCARAPTRPVRPIHEAPQQVALRLYTGGTLS